MKMKPRFINLLFITGLLFSTFIACDKTDDQSAGDVKDADGNVYKTVKIGKQVWMAENLKTTKYRNGDLIPNVTDNWFDLLSGAYCDYDDSPINGTYFGKLYNWYAVNDSRNIAPTGWHIPTEEEWNTLFNYVNANLGDSEWLRKALAAKTDWSIKSYTGAIGNDLTKNNSSGFTALPGGHRIDGYNFSSIGCRCYFWGSTEYDTEEAYSWMLDCQNWSDSYHKSSKMNGLSVRCLKD